MKYPKKKGYTIYTKNNCSFCVKAKKLLDDKNIKYSLIECDDLLKDRDKFFKLISKYTNQKTFPIIFYDGKIIGGYTDLRKYLSTDESLFIKIKNFLNSFK
jgi:glutaredoxin